MTFSSNSSGQVHQEPKEGTRWVSVYNIVRCWCVHGPVAVARELILDEHVECGCKCGPGEIKMLLLHYMYNIIGDLHQSMGDFKDN